MFLSWRGRCLVVNINSGWIISDSVWTELIMQITVAGWKQKTLIIILVKVVMWGSEAGSSWHFMQQMYRYGPRVTFCLDLWNTIAIIIINSAFIRKDLICLFGWTIGQTSSFPRPIVKQVLDFSKTRKVQQKLRWLYISISRHVRRDSFSPPLLISPGPGAKQSLITVLSWLSRCEVWGVRTKNKWWLRYL